MKHSQTGKESGASDVPFITQVKGEYLLPFGRTPNDTLIRHREAIDNVKPPEPTAPMKAGNYFQDALMHWFNDEFNCAIMEPKKGYRNKHCNMVASLDGIFTEDWQYEGTTVKAGNLWECKHPGRPSNPSDAMERVLQVQAQMDCTDTDICVIGELARSDLQWRIAFVPRHEPSIKAIREAVNIFWDHMGNDTNYPPVTNEEANRYYDANYFQPIDLTDGPCEEIKSEARGHLIDAADTYLAAERAVTAGKKCMEENALIMKHILGGVEKVQLPDNRMVNFTTVNYKAQPEKIKITPAKDAYTTRRFKIKES